MLDKKFLRRKVLRLGQTVTHGTSRVTSSRRIAPNVLLVGAQRAGTTSLYKTLVQHPAIIGGILVKEVHYFDVNYSKGMPWYRSRFPMVRTALRKAGKSGCSPQVVDATPYYMFHPLAPGRIAHDLPGARVLVLLRDPVERAYSAHAHEIALGYESEPFEHALELEPQRLQGEEERMLADASYNSYSHQHHAYVARGEYLTQLERLEDLVGRDSMHVVESDDLFLDAEPAVKGILDFLNVPFAPEMVFRQHNDRPRSTMPAEIRSALTRHYEPHDLALAKWLGHTPSWRR